MGINLTFPLRPGSAGAFATNDSTIDAVVDDLKLLLLSNHGERPIHGDFGANLRSIVFDPGPGVLQRAEDLVLSAIEKWMPFVQVNTIEVSDSTTDTTLQSNELRIKLNFTVGQIEGSLNQRIRN
jgi:phage baseplate assembly protein W